LFIFIIVFVIFVISLLLLLVLFNGIFADAYLIMASRKSKEPCSEGVEAFVRGMTSEVNAADVGRMMALQQHMYVTCTLAFS